MDYEKKYKDALERAKELIEKRIGKNKDFYTEDYSYIFPELAESEDERIRKDLIAFLIDMKDGDVSCFPSQSLYQRWLVYLEKQKEQKHPNGCFTCDEYKKGYEEGRRNGFTAGYNKAMKEVEQKEQKPVKCELEDAFKYYTDAGITVSCGDIVAKPKEQKLNFDTHWENGSMVCEQKKQKPVEWSDTDTIGWDEAFACVTRAEKSAKNEEELQNAVTAEKWLKEIKFKYYVHPVKQKWSEEDEEMLDAMIDIVSNSLYEPLCPREGMLVWLRSLRPQPRWKPSYK